MVKQADFSSIAPFYRWLEYVVFGNRLQTTRCAFLDEIGTDHRLLILGDGDGRFTAEYLRRNPYAADLHMVDNSPGMVRLCRRRLDGYSVSFHETSALELASAMGSNVIVSHFFLDCFSTAELQVLIRRLGGFLPSQGRWIVSEFAASGGFLWKNTARALIWFMYVFFHFTARLNLSRLPDYAEVFRENGFVLHREEKQLRGLLIAQIWKKT